jgi:hypothetical protein
LSQFRYKLEYLHLIILLVVLFLAELFIDPRGEFPLNDDWSYTQSLQKFSNTGVINIGNFPSMGLLPQILWGTLFVKIFGFSILILRISTLVSFYIGLVFLYRLCILIQKNRSIAFLACASLLFNPLIMMLSNSFMTDVNFNTLIIISCYFGIQFIKKRNWKDYALFILSSACTVLLRQIGIILPFCLLASLLLFNIYKISGKSLVQGVIACGITLAALKYYESYLHSLPDVTTYKFSGQVDFLAPQFWTDLWNRSGERWRELLQHELVYPAVFFIPFLKSLVRITKWNVLIPAVLSALIVVYLIFKKYDTSSPTLFTDSLYGVETFYESFLGARHNRIQDFTMFMFYLKMLLSFISASTIFTGLYTILRNRTPLNIECVFICLLLLSYSISLFVTEAYFSRYHIPTTFLLIVLFCFYSENLKINWRWSVIPLIFWCILSIISTKDYIQMNRTKWTAYNYLRKSMHIPKEKINGGFEIACWNEGKGWGWNDFLNLNDFNYLIQFNPEKSFRHIKSFPFKKYFPPKIDTINVYQRIQDGGNIERNF